MTKRRAAESRDSIISGWFGARRTSYQAITAAAAAHLGETPYWALISQDERDEMAKSGAAMPDGSYPIKTCDGENSVDSAISAVGRGGADHDAIRRHIIKRADSLGCSSKIPENWNSDGSLKDAAASTTAEGFAAPPPPPAKAEGDGPVPPPPAADKPSAEGGPTDETKADATVSAHVDAAVQAVKAALKAQQGDPGNEDDPADAKVLAGLEQVDKLYQVPGTRGGNALLHYVSNGWALDSLLRANSAQPVNIVTGQYSFGLVWNNDAINQRPDIVAGTPMYLSGAACAAANSGSPCPGGRRLNPDHFSTPTDTFTQGTLRRNQLRGFDAVQEDLALRREFPIHDAVSLEFRAEAFNVLNHPMFGDVGTQSDGRNLLNNSFFGISAHSLADSLGSGGADGGLSSLYQIGSPRSMQFALKLKF